MHIFVSIVLVLGAALVLVLGLVDVLRDLIMRGPHDTPLIEDDGTDKRIRRLQ
jgi:hypothetical protein